MPLPPKGLHKAIATVRDLRREADSEGLRELERTLGGMLPPITGTAIIVLPPV